MLSKQYTTTRPSRLPGVAMAAIATLAAAALVVKQKTAQVEADHPPQGKFIEVNGVRLHYIERGVGEPIVLIHGNGSMLDDFISSGVIDGLTGNHRVIAFDRPGFGYSQRPDNRRWDQHAQAELLHQALQQLGVASPIVVGHSWGSMVATAMALAHPESLKRLVLISGYYYPTPRLDVPVMSLPAAPGIGTVMRHTASPLISRLMWPLIRKKLFAPSEVSDSFKKWPVWMNLRPTQLRASAAETAMMITGAATMKEHYPSLTMPVTIIAGDGDQVVDTPTQSQQLHEAIAQSSLIIVPNAGHMLQHIDPQAVIAAILNTTPVHTSLPAKQAAS